MKHRHPHLRGPAVLALIALLGGCGHSGHWAWWSDASICAAPPPPREDVPANAYQQAVARDECIHLWSYRYASSPDDADAVVGAVVGACRSTINRSASLLSQGDADAERFYLREMEGAARERALYRVVQARAGNCSSTPAAPAPQEAQPAAPAPAAAPTNQAG